MNKNNPNCSCHDDYVCTDCIIESEPHMWKVPTGLLFWEWYDKDGNRICTKDTSVCTCDKCAK